MVREKILLPFKFTDYDQRALDFIIRHFAHLKDVKITLFHAYTPPPEIETKDSPVMGRLREGLISLAQRIQDQEAGLKAAAQKLLENGFSEDQVRYVFMRCHIIRSGLKTWHITSKEESYGWGR